MANITDYLKLTYTAATINTIYSDSDTLKSQYRLINESEKKAFARHYIINNAPYVFKDRPLVYEQLTQYLADELDINPLEVKLVGSAKTGFSIDPSQYGKAFSENSDLDFVIINETLFNLLENDFKKWADLFQKGEMNPLQDTEREYWTQNLTTGEEQLAKGFINTHFIPNRELFETTKKTNNSLWRITSQLKLSKKLIVKKTTLRVYKNWNYFTKQTNRNIEVIMKQL